MDRRKISNILKSIFAPIGIIVLICIFIVGYYFVTFASERTIAESILISRDWQEIKPSPPLKLKKTWQYVALKIGEGDVKFIDFDDWTNIELKDGSSATPEIEIIDEYKNVFKLKVTLISGGGIIGFSPESTIGFPKDRIYKKVRIRSDTPFRCTITWFCTRTK